MKILVCKIEAHTEAPANQPRRPAGASVGARNETMTCQTEKGIERHRHTNRTACWCLRGCAQRQVVTFQSEGPQQHQHAGRAGLLAPLRAPTVGFTVFQLEQPRHKQTGRLVPLRAPATNNHCTPNRSAHRGTNKPYLHSEGPLHVYATHIHDEQTPYGAGSSQRMQMNGQ